MTDRIPATFAIPQEPGQPLDIEFRHEALRLAVVDRDQWSTATAASWQNTGVYLLFGPALEDARGRYSVYVGKAAPGTIAGRITDHVRNRESWDRALLVRRAGEFGFNSTDVGWLEGELHRVLSTAPPADVLNKTTPGDDTLSAWDRDSLGRVVTLIRSVMRVLGFRTDLRSGERPAEQVEEPSPTDVITPYVERAHEVINLIRAGEWATYGDVADVLDSHPNALGSHIRSCRVADGTPEWRLLNRRGESAPGFIWTTSGHAGTQIDVLQAEGVRLIEGDRADPSQQVDTEALRLRLLEAQEPS